MNEQSKAASFIEAITNTVIGFVINLVANYIIFPLFGLYIDLKTNIVMGLFYTIISVARGYVLRRFFLKSFSYWVSIKTINRRFR